MADESLDVVRLAAQAVVRHRMTPAWRASLGRDLGFRVDDVAAAIAAEMGAARAMGGDWFMKDCDLVTLFRPIYDPHPIAIAALTAWMGAGCDPVRALTHFRYIEAFVSATLDEDGALLESAARRATPSTTPEQLAAALTAQVLPAVSLVH